MPTGDQLALRAVSQMSDSNIGGDLSPLGNLALSMTKRAVAMASDGIITPEEIASASADAAYHIMSNVQGVVQELIADVVQTATSEGLQNVASAIPIIGAAVDIIMGVADLFKGISEARAEQHDQTCSGMFVPLPSAPWGSGPNGSVVPADMFHGAAAGPFANLTPSVVKIIGLTVEKYGGAGPLNELRKSVSQFGAPDPYPGLTGVPKAIRDQLKELRMAMYTMRETQSVDGGRSIWPLYIDLLAAQFRLNRISVNYITFKWLGTEGSGCSDVDAYWKPARDELKGLLHAWETTVNPVYGVDKLAMQSLFEKALGSPKTKVNPLSGLQGADVHQLQIRAALNQHGLRNLTAAHSALSPRAPSSAPLARLTHSFSTRVAPTVGPTMSPGEHQRIIDAIIAAAHGDGHPPVGRELSVDADLNPNDPMTAMPEFPQYQDVEFDDDDYAVVDQYFAKMQGDIGGDDYSYYGSDCFQDAEAWEAEDDEELDPWGDQFIGVGASRATQVQHLQPVAKKLLPAKPPPKVAQPIRNIAPVLPKPLVQPLRNVPMSAMPKPPPPPLKPVVRLQPIAKAAAKALPQPKIQQLQGLHRLPIKQERPHLPLRPLRPLPSVSPQAPGPSINDAYGADESSYYGDDDNYDGGYSEFSGDDAMANDQMSDDELAQGYDEYDEGEGQDEPADATSWGYGYGDFGDEECYPHDGSTYGWDD